MFKPDIAELESRLPPDRAVPAGIHRLKPGFQ